MSCIFRWSLDNFFSLVLVGEISCKIVFSSKQASVIWIGTHVGVYRGSKIGVGTGSYKCYRSSGPLCLDGVYNVLL